MTDVSSLGNAQEAELWRDVCREGSPEGQGRNSNILNLPRGKSRHAGTVSSVAPEMGWDKVTWVTGELKAVVHLYWKNWVELGLILNHHSRQPTECLNMN